MNVLLTGYFCRAPDPQRGRRVAADSDDLVQGFMAGAQKLELHTRIFHDGLGEAFIQKHSTELVRFEPARLAPRQSCNDERFFIYRRWLSAQRGVSSVFCTDLFDIRICRDPHQLVEGPKLWVGSEPWSMAERVGMHNRFERAYGEIPPNLRDRQILNAGIFGGTRDTVLAFLDAMCDEIRALRASARTAFNCNMAAYNAVLYSNAWASRVHAPGKPLHSVFGSYEPDSDAYCFVHR